MSKNAAPVNATILPRSRRSILRGLAAAQIAAVTVGASGASAGAKYEMTDAELAALDFEAWAEEKNDHLKFSNEEIAGVFATVRLAWVMMGKSKPDLVKVAGTLWSAERDNSNLFVNTIKGFQEATDYLKACLKIVESAECRLMVSLATIEQAEDDATRKAATIGGAV